MKNTLLNALPSRRNAALDATHVPIESTTYGELVTPLDSELDKALRRSTAGTVSTLQGLGGAVQDLYDPAGARETFDRARERVEQVNRANPAQTPHIKDINSLSDALLYVPSAVGEMAPTMATALAGGVAGRGLAARFAPKLLEKPLAAELTGSAVGLFPQEAGETAMSLALDPEAMKNTTAGERLALAAGKGGVNAILEGAVPAWTASKLTGSTAKQAVAKGEALRHIGKTALKGGVAEGATEGAQEVVGGLTHKIANPEHYIDPWDIADAAVKGAIPGHGLGTLGGVGDVVHSNLGAKPEADSTPTRDKIAEAVGGFAGKAAAKAMAAAEKRLDAHLAPNVDADFQFFTRPDDIDATGRSDAELMGALDADDSARQEAAVRYAQKTVQRASTSDVVSDEELKTALEYLAAVQNGQGSPSTTQAFGDAIGGLKRRSNAQNTLLDATSDLVERMQARKGNAMTPAGASDARAQQVDQIMQLWHEDAAQSNPLFADVDPSDPQVSVARRALGQWISNGFAAEKGGKKFIPKRFVEALGDDAGDAVLSAYKLLRDQGLTDVTALEALKMARAIEGRQSANRGTLSFVLESFTPLARQSFGGREQTAEKAKQVLSALRLYGQGSVDMTPEADKMLSEYFGPNKQRVLNAFKRKQAEGGAETKLDGVGAQTGVSAEDEANPDLDAQTAQDYETGLNTEWSPDTSVVYHGFGKDNKAADTEFPTAARDILNKRNEVAGANQQSHVRVVGVHDRLREEHSGDREALRRAEDELLSEHNYRISEKDTAGREKALANINRKLRFVREEIYSDKSELEVKSVDSFKETTGKGGEFSTIKHGRIYLEREHIDPETGEITTKEFVTSAAKLIKFASKTAASAKQGASAMHDNLMAGLSALLNSKDGRFTSKVGYKTEAGGKVHWLKKNEPLPESFAFFGEKGATEADAKTEKAANLTDDQKIDVIKSAAKIVWRYDELKAKALSDLVRVDPNVEAIDAAVEILDIPDASLDNVYDAAVVLRDEARLAYEHGQDTASDTDPMLGKEPSRRNDVVPSEVEPGGNRPIQRHKDLRGEPITSEPTGELTTGDKRVVVPTLKPQRSAKREDAAGKVPSREVRRASAKQLVWLVDTLRKGVPALVAAVKQMSESQRDGVSAALVELRTIDQNDARLAEAKITNFKEFKKRAEIALKSLGGVEESADASDDRHYRGLVQPPDVLAVADADKVVWALFEDDGNGDPTRLVGYTTNFNAANYVAEKDGLVKVQDKVANLRKASAQSTAPRVELPRTSPYTRKDQVKSDKANKFIGRGSPKSSTAAYAKAWGNRANTGEYSSSDTVFLSVEGDRAGRLRVDVTELQKAMDAGATIITDDRENRARSYNVGEREAASYIAKHGYVEKSPGEWVPVKSSAQSTAPAKQLTAAERKAIVDEAQQVLGPDVKVEFERFIEGTDGSEWSGEWTEKLIKISVGAIDHAGVGRHESVHQLFSWLRKHGATNIKKLIENAATNPAVKRQLERMLSDHPNAIKQLSDPEEAAAYLYQFWKAGQVRLGEQTEGFFKKVAKATGRLWQRFAAHALGSSDAKAAIAERDNTARAEVLLQFFAEGKFAGGDEAVLKTLDAKLGEQMKQAVAKGFVERFTQNDVLRKVAFTAGSALRDTGNPYFQQIADMFATPEGGKLGAQALFEATAQERARRLNALNKILLDKDPEDLKLALKYLQSRTDDRNIHAPAVKEIVQGAREFFVGMHDYMQERGIKRWNEEANVWVPVPAISHNYFPVSWGVDKIAANPKAFVDRLLEVHTFELEKIASEANAEVASGANAGEFTASAAVQGREITAEDVANAIATRIITSSGAADISESTSSLGITPFAKSVNKRSLWWLEHDKFTDFMSDDLVQIMTNYTVQIVKRGEYVSRFGNEGEILQDLTTKAYITELLGEKGVAKAEKKHKQMVDEWQAHRDAANGTLGQNKPTLRQAAESLLPATERDARVQEALEKVNVPIKAIMAGEGTLGRDIDPNVRQIMSGVMTYQNMRLMALSLFSSIIDPLGMLIRGGTLNDSWQGFVRGVQEVVAQIKGQHTNDLAAQLAEDLGTVDASTYLDALGQTYSSLFIQGKLHRLNNSIFKWNGMEAWNRAMRIQATQAAIGFIKRHLSSPTKHSERYLKDELGLDPKLKDQYMKDGELDYTNDAVKAAIMRWVDGAILRPNAMQRPIVASDPHYALFYHLKQFAYSFHKTILRRAMVEAKHDNYAPTVALLSTYVPVMVAADVIKEVLVPGDDPAWMRGGLGDYFTHGFLRANLLGVPQFAFDAYHNPLSDPVRSVEGVAGLFGPTASQVTGVLLAPLTEKHTAGGELINAAPGAVILNRMTR